MNKILSFFQVFRHTQKIAWDAPKWGREVLFPANPNLADILGDTDFDFENFYFFDFFGPSLGPAWAQLGPGLGPAWAHPLGPSLGSPTWVRQGPTHLGTHLGPTGTPGALCWAGGPSGASGDPYARPQTVLRIFVSFIIYPFLGSGKA